MVNMTIRIERETFKAIKRIAEEQGRSHSSLVRLVMKEYVKRKKPIQD